MKYIEVEGGACLQGTLSVQGSKNAALPMMAAALLTKQPVTLHDCPDIEDTRVMCELLKHMGVDVKQEGKTLHIHARSVRDSKLPYELVRKMRSSIMVMGALLCRTGYAEMAFPGGCVIGARPIDLHISGLRELGYEIEETETALIGRYVPELSSGVRQIHLNFPSVGATENILMGAVHAGGRTVLTGAACEPEVRELALMLQQMGARMEGIGSEKLCINGTQILRGVERTVPKDRIVAGTYLVAAALTGGRVEIIGLESDDVEALLTVLKQMGCHIEIKEKPCRIILEAPKTLKAVDIHTAPHPGFPTDMQAMIMVAMTQAEGVSHIRETIFENRFRHVEALRRMGAHIDVRGDMAIVHGKTPLQADILCATDLRAGAAMVLAGLCAKGKSQIEGLEHIERGYENLVRDLTELGGKVSQQ